jgi:hypothetical protein
LNTRQRGSAPPMAASPGFFGVFFSGHFQIHGNLEIRFSCAVYWGGGFFYMAVGFRFIVLARWTSPRAL